MGAKARKEQLRRRSVRAGVLTFIALALLSTFAITAQNGLPSYLPGVSRTTVKVAFEDLGALRAGDDVRIANVRSGFVQSIGLVDGDPVATLQLEHGRAVYRDAKAGIGARSALGQKYVELDPGKPAAGRVVPGTTIAKTSTTSAVELDEVLDVFDGETRAATKTTVEQVGGGLAGRGQDLNDGLSALPKVLPDLGGISRALSEDGGADLAAMLRAADAVASSLDGQGEQLASTTRQLATTLDAINTADGDPLAESLRTAPETLADAKAALDSLDAPLAATQKAATALAPGAAALAKAVPDTRGVLREAVPVLDKVPALTDDTKKAVERLTPTLVRADPLVQQLGTTFARAKTPLAVLAPYADEVVLFFRNAASALSQGDGAGRWLRFYPVLAPEALIGTLPLRDPTTSREAYPAPGVAKTHTEKSILGEGFK